MINYNNYNPYQSMESWYGVPDYGGAYNSYLGSQAQPLSLGRIVSMVRDLQNSQMRQPIGNQSFSVSPITQAQIPAQIAASVMNTGNRLLSQPRQQVARSGFNQLPEENLQPNAPADNQMPQGGSVGSGKGNLDYSNIPNPSLPRAQQTSVDSPYKQAVGLSPKPVKANKSGGGLTSADLPKPQTANHNWNTMF